MASRSNWSDSEAIVLESDCLVDVLSCIVERHGPSSVLLFCGSKDEFVDQLRHAISEDVSTREDGLDEDGRHGGIAQHHLLQPTIHMLSSVAGLKMAFCLAVPHTLAYLSSLLVLVRAGGVEEEGLAQKSKPKLLVIINPVAQHAGTRSDSAHGLTKLFAAALATANEMRAKLVVAECRDQGRPSSSTNMDDLWPRDDDEQMAAPTVGLWDQKIPITNAKAKGAALRKAGWQGRTVSIRSVAEKWCRFERLE